MVNKHELKPPKLEDISCTTSAALLPSHVFELKEGGRKTSELKQFLLPLDGNVCGLKQT